MATTRIMSLHIGKGRTVGKAISDIIDYVENPDKTDGGRLISSYQCDSRIADAEFLFAKRQYLARTGSGALEIDLQNRQLIEEEHDVLGSYETVYAYAEDGSLQKQ